MSVNSVTTVLPPPTERFTTLGWLKKNLFSNWYNTLLTLVMLFLAYVLIKPLLVWSFSQARWDVISQNLKILLTGTYPAEMLWRIWATVMLLVLIAGLTWGAWVKGHANLGMLLLAFPLLLALLPFELNIRITLIAIDILILIGFKFASWRGPSIRRFVLTLWLAYFPIAILLIRGITPEGGLIPEVGTKDWGGLLLTLILTIVGIVLSFPIGVLLALGRRSKLPIISSICVVFIEFVRGVPLVTILFMAQLMLPLLLPANVTLDRILRAMAGITLFSAAYMAENVRGGLQSIPRGQIEAAYALGLNPFLTMILIILPQALRAVIPVIVGQFIGLFKDTSLVAVVGLLDLLGISGSVLANPKFIGTQKEVYLFVGLLYWIFSYAMSYASRRLELYLGVGER